MKIFDWRAEQQDLCSRMEEADAFFRAWLDSGLGVPPDCLDEGRLLQHGTKRMSLFFGSHRDSTLQEFSAAVESIARWVGRPPDKSRGTPTCKQSGEWISTLRTEWVLSETYSLVFSDGWVKGCKVHPDKVKAEILETAGALHPECTSVLDSLTD